MISRRAAWPTNRPRHSRDDCCAATGPFCSSHERTIHEAIHAFGARFGPLSVPLRLWRQGAATSKSVFSSRGRRFEPEPNRLTWFQASPSRRAPCRVGRLPAADFRFLSERAGKAGSEREARSGKAAVRFVSPRPGTRARIAAATLAPPSQPRRRVKIQRSVLKAASNPSF